MKIFCIGFNKTGTTSLHNFFTQSGLSSRHDHYWASASHLPDVKSRLSKHTCYSDGEFANFRNLHNRFRKSVFILNTRPLKPWLRSRVKHVCRFGDPKTLEKLPKGWGVMATLFFADPELSIKKWILDRAIYHAAARQYFADHDRFIELDVTHPDTDAGQLSKTLQGFGFRLKYPLVTTFPVRNVRADSVVAPEMLETYLDMVDRCVATAASEHGRIEL